MTRRKPLLLLFLFPALAMASLPLVDFDRMGTVGLAGSFAGLDLFANTSVSFDPSTSSLLTRSNDGALTFRGSTNTGGSIVAACSLGDSLYFAGSFSSIGGVSAQNVASYSYSSNSFSSLGSNGPNGDIAAVFCDASQNTLWVGGQFTSPSPSVAVWDTKASSWSAAPFGGLSGAGGEVHSITANASQSSLIFAGSFTTAFGNGSRVLNGTNNPNVPFSSGATPFSSSLVPVPLTNAQVNPSSSTSQDGFKDIQAILCPAGADGPGNTWLAEDGNRAVITVRKFASLEASGIRLGNTFVQGRGTTGFSVTTIPDNTPRTLQFIDPTTGQNQTCSTDCSLLTDSSVPYQDFIFTDGSLNITGFQLTLTQWKGAGPGLHLLQLLSSGAFASSIAANNGQSCFAPSASNATMTGTWVEKDVNTGIAGTQQAVLATTIDVGTPSSQAASFTWMPYVSASGVYAVNMLIPGCTNFQDCPLRTSVKVTVFPGGGQSPTVLTFSQANPEDQTVTLYTGPVVPTSGNFSMTVIMALADQPEGQGQNGKYELVADRVQLILQSANITGSTTSTGSTNGTSVGSQTGFGVFEWPLNGQQSVNTNGALPNSSLTALDSAGFNLLSALGTGNDQSSSIVNAVVQAPSGTLFIGGKFTLSSGSAAGTSNVVMFKDGALVALSNNGLDGAVTSLALHDDTLFIGGSFSDTASPSTSGKLRGVAAYDVQGNQWVSLDGGLAGTVASITLAGPDVLLAAGNFSAAADGQTAQGLAAWNITSRTWSNSGGFLMGQLSLVGNATTSTNGVTVDQAVAGNVAASLKFGTSGFALLQNNGDSDVPKVTPLGVDLQSPLSTNTSSTSANARRHLSRAHGSMSWYHKIGGIFKRQSATAAQLAPLPSPAATSGPSVLAGAYWTNTTSSRQIIILGGNFTFTTSSGSTSQNIAFYDAETSTIEALDGNQLNGTVRSLLVVDDDLYIGGTFTIQGTQFNGFAIYNLARGEWDTVGSQAVGSASSSQAVVVRSITVSPSQENTVIIAGTFTQVGSTTCRAVCEYNTQQRKWSAMGNGIQGEATTVSYAGDKRDTVVVAGSLALADGTVANVAQFAIANSTWTSVGGSNDLPGPVTAMEVNNGNGSSIFAAGKSTDGTSSFLMFWNGQTWAAVGSGFAASTDVAQLTMVPLQNTHTANSIVESDRMLWISGALSDTSFGNASAALYDGENIIPYIITAEESGTAGAVASLFHSFSSFSFTQRHFLAVGIVILISIAIAAGVVFLLALIGILWTLLSRKDEKVDKFDLAEVDDDDSTTHRPSSLLEHINAATRTTIIGQSPFGGPSSEKGADTAANSSDPFGPDASNFARAETPSDAIGGIMAGEEVSRPAHARYSFDGKGEGELPMTAGQEVEVLDDGDAAWWYARDARTGKEGVVPAAYVY